MKHQPLIVALVTSSFFISCGKEKTKTEYVPFSQQCNSELRNECEEIRIQIDRARRELQDAINHGDERSIYLSQIRVNELIEIRETYLDGQQDISEIRDRYQALRSTLKSLSDVTQIAGITYHPDEVESVRAVFKDYGELFLNINSSQTTESSSEREKNLSYEIEGDLPWASYWYPKRSKALFEGIDSPLSKFDRYLNSINVNSSSAKWEANSYSSFSAEWEGHCDAWAVASVLTQEPIRTFSVNGIDFSVSDLKALAIKYFEGYQSKIYGLRYNGLADTDGQIQDLRPEAFHRLVQVILGEKKQALLIDEDPGPEIWAKPIFRMSWRITPDPEIENAIIVKAFPWMIKQRNQIEERLTDVSKDIEAPALEYRLFYDPNVMREDEYKIIAGEWINSSKNFHPDTIFVPDVAINENQMNPEIAKNHEELRKLLIKAGMLPG